MREILAIFKAERCCGTSQEERRDETYDLEALDRHLVRERERERKRERERETKLYVCELRE